MSTFNRVIQNTSTGIIAGIFLLSLFVFTNCDDSDDVDPCLENGPKIHVVSVDETEVGIASGSIDVQAYGGVAPYEYSIDDSPYQSSGTFTDLASNEYDISAKDNNGCVTETRVSVDEKTE
jgi:hypothetical protein